MSRIIAGLIALFLAVPAAIAQHFGEWSTPVNLGPKINSAAADGCPNISKDGRSLFFASTRPGGSGGFDIYVTQRATADAEWGTPENLGINVNSSGNEICPTLSLDERRLFFVSDRPGGCGGQDIYVAHRRSKSDPHGWEPALNLGCTVNTLADEFGPAYYEDDDTGDITLYFTSNRLPGKGGADIYRSVNFGQATLVDELSTSFDDARPTIRHDGREIIFDSTRPGALGGSDLWVATRKSAQDPWSEPVWMQAVNSSGNEVRPSLSFDGMTLYLTSNRPGGSGMVDVWMSTRERINHREKFEPTIVEKMQ
jgi:Tol biopolymer transport system component